MRGQKRDVSDLNQEAYHETFGEWPQNALPRWKDPDTTHSMFLHNIVVVQCALKVKQSDL